MKTKHFFTTLILGLTLLSGLFIACEKNTSTDMLSTEQSALKTDLNWSACFDRRMVDLSKDCGDTYEPVCACNAITFENHCQAEAAGFTNIKPGPCHEVVNCKSEIVDNFFDENWSCATVYDPVCGCNGQTYSNWCGALMDGVTVWTPGECYTPIKDEVTDILKQYIDIDCYDEEHDPEVIYVCTDEIRPVCACQVIEFSNPCHARKAGFENFEEGKCYQNRCQSDLVKSLMNKAGMNCMDVYDPVCGCDGKTYSNSCYAVRNGVLAYTKGACMGNSGIGNPF